MIKESFKKHGRIKRYKTSKYKGVSKNKYGRFHVIIRCNKKNIFSGSFNTEIEAAIAYNKRAIELLGKHAILNII